MQVVTFRLTSGEELIATLLAEQHGFLEVQSPLRIQLGQSPDGSLQLGFAEWPEFADPNQHQLPVRIPISAVSCMPQAPYSQLEAQYTSTVTGVLVPPTPKILVE